jgi:hypothetical protein
MTQTAWILSADHPDGEWIHPDQSLTIDGESSIALEELFAEVDKML